jgi:hypothetical protein
MCRRVFIRPGYGRARIDSQGAGVKCEFLMITVLGGVGVAGGVTLLVHPAAEKCSYNHNSY